MSRTTGRTLIAFMIAGLFLFPVYWMAITSLKTEQEIFAYPPSFFPGKITLEGYVHQLTSRTRASILTYFMNSVLISTFTMVISIGLSVFAAYGLAKFRPRINRYLLLMFLVTQMMPTVLFLAPLFIIFNRVHLLDSLIAPIVSTCLHAIPFCVLILRPYFLSVPGELEDAAVIDGCNRLTSLVYVIIPVVCPGILVTAAFSFLFGWGNLMAPLTFIRTERNYPLTVNLYKAIGEYGTDWNSLMAYAVVVTVPVVLIFSFLQRYIVSGLTSGALKG